MGLRSALGELRRATLCSVAVRRASLQSQEPIVSFCFDDFPRTAYKVGGTILQNFGARGTYYAAMGLVNEQNSLGEQFRPDDLESLVAAGHELGSHTFSHLSCRNVPFEVFEKDVQKGRESIKEKMGCDTVSFAYPYGHVTLAAKKRIGGQMGSCRGIYGGLNGTTIDLNLLRANSVYGEVDRFAELESLLIENQRQKGWLIFYTHDVRTSPSPFGCTPALLEKVVAGAMNRGFRIVPVSEALECVQTLSS